MQPTPAEIRGELDRILASEVFANADRLSRFLRYVVNRALAGEADRLKEYVIGTEVFDRGEQYDPRLDSIVRVEAGRLRSKLEEYYSRPGAGAAIRIAIPRGSYAPTFDVRRPAPTPRVPVPRRLVAAAAAVFLLGLAAWGAAKWTAAETRAPRASIAVLPFRTYSPDRSAALLAERLTDGITGELAKAAPLQVVSNTSARELGGARGSLRQIAQSLGAEILMEGSLTVEGERVRVQARLVDAALDRKFWVETFTADVGAVDDLQRRIASAAAAAVAANEARSSP